MQKTEDKSKQKQDTGNLDSDAEADKPNWQISRGKLNCIPPHSEKKLNLIRGQLLDIEKRSRESSRDRDQNFILQDEFIKNKVQTSVQRPSSQAIQSKQHKRPPLYNRSQQKTSEELNQILAPANQIQPGIAMPHQDTSH